MFTTSECPTNTGTRTGRGELDPGIEDLLGLNNHFPFFLGWPARYFVPDAVRGYCMCDLSSRGAGLAPRMAMKYLLRKPKNRAPQCDQEDDFNVCSWPFCDMAWGGDQGRFQLRSGHRRAG